MQMSKNYEYKLALQNVKDILKSEEEYIKDFAEGVIDIIDSENSGRSVEQRLDEITDYVKTLDKLTDYIKNLKTKEK